MDESDRIDLVEWETKSATTTCPLCGTLQAVSRCEWWTETTLMGEPLSTPQMVCRDVRGCAYRASMRVQLA